MNLRDKLRGQTPANLESTVPAAEPTAAFQEAASAPEAAPSKGKGQKAAAGLPALDGNRRFWLLAAASRPPASRSRCWWRKRTSTPAPA